MNVSQGIHGTSQCQYISKLICSFQAVKNLLVADQFPIQFACMESLVHFSQTGPEGYASGTYSDVIYKVMLPFMRARRIVVP
jgi:hypothetical protein